MKPSLYACLFAGLVASAPAMAINGYFVDAGGNEDLQSVGLGMIRQWTAQWFTEGSWHLTGYWEGTLDYVHSSDSGGNSLADLGVSPVFRFRPNASGGAQPYWDFGIGLHLVSRVHLDDHHNLGTNLQFGPLVGFGFTFGDKSEFDLGYRFQHISNADLSPHNDGFDVHLIRLTYLY